MPESRSISVLLRRVQRRLRWQRALDAVANGAVAGLGACTALSLWNRLLPVAWAWGEASYWAVGAAVLVRVLWKAVPAPAMWRVARYVDETAGLHDEISSALWFSRHDDQSRWVTEHLSRAAGTAAGLDTAVIAPVRRPLRTHAALGLLGAWLLVSILPIPRVFEGLPQDLAALTSPAQESAVAPVAQLQEKGAAPEPPAEQGSEDQPVELPRLQEQASGEEPAEGSPGQEAGSEGSEDASAEPGSEPGPLGDEPRGEPTQSPQGAEMPDAAEGKPVADPSGAQPQGEGESTDVSGSMLAGNDEVFLQQGGEDLQRNQGKADEENLGHATREGGGEQELQEGRATSLQVQLQREILEIPELQEPERDDEEKQQLVTREEQSFLQFERIRARTKFAGQELLESESIPWRYQRSVLEYFRTLRARDNEDEGKQE